MSLVYMEKKIHDYKATHNKGIFQLSHQTQENGASTMNKSILE